MIVVKVMVNRGSLEKKICDRNSLNKENTFVGTKKTPFVAFDGIIFTPSVIIASEINSPTPGTS